jgi:DNA-binding transcriptional regulator LsrR (DeoR family)
VRPSLHPHDWDFAYCPSGIPHLPCRPRSRSGEAARLRKDDRKLDLAARAAWLYYVAGKRQEEIAEQLNVSRQAVQRLVSLAVSEKLIKFRLDHPIAECMRLAEELKARYGLAYCSVQPTDGGGEHPAPGIAMAAAEHLTTYLGAREPVIVAFSTGRMLRAMADEMPAMDCPQHKLVSLVGTISRDGQASSYEVVRRFAERTGAQCFPIPTPAVASSVEERRLLQTQRSFAVVRDLASQAVVAFVGVGNIRWQSPMHRDHFVTDEEITELIERGAVGEIAGWAYDGAGRMVASSVNDRNAALPLSELKHTRMIGVSGSPDRVIAISAALRGGLLGGLITDEGTAVALLRTRSSLDSAA